MAAIWPATLPEKTQRGGFVYRPGMNVIVTQMDKGPDVKRRRGTSAPTEQTWTFHMDSAQIATFLAFFETTLNYGADPFQHSDPITGTDYNWDFDLKKGGPNIVPLGGDYYRVVFPVLRREAV